MAFVPLNTNNSNLANYNSVNSLMLEYNNYKNQNFFTPTGVINIWSTKVAPKGWLICDGSAISRTQYTNLFNTLNPRLGTFTITIASPGVGTLNSHGLETGERVWLSTTGSLPTGLAVNTAYFAIRIDANTFRLATSKANADAGTAINTSGTQSGTHTISLSPYGIGDGTTTFNIPNLKGQTIVGVDTSQTEFNALGETGGAKTHTLTTTEIPAHTHTSRQTYKLANPVASGFNGEAITGSANPTAEGVYNAMSTVTTSSTGGGGAHNNLQPYIVINYIIKI